MIDWSYSKYLQAKTAIAHALPRVGKGRAQVSTGGGRLANTRDGYWTSDAYAKNLVGTQGIKTYAKMLTHPLVGGIYRMYSLPILSAMYDVEASDERVRRFIAGQLGIDLFDDDENIIPLAEDERGSVNWLSFLESALTMHAYGFSVFENVFARRNNRIVLKDKIYLPPKTIAEYAMEGSRLKSVTQQVDAKPIELSGDNISFMTYGRRGNDLFGRSLFYSAYRPYFELTELERLDTVSHLRYAVGVFLSYWRSKTQMTPTNEQKAAQEKLMEAMQKGELTYILDVTGQWGYNMLQGDRGRPTDVKSSWERAQWHILMSTLTTFVQIGTTSGSGAYSSAEVFARNFYDSLLSSVKLIFAEEQIKTVDSLVYWNFGRDAWARLVVTGLDPEVNQQIEEEKATEDESNDESD